jgi:small neutral amino acid transporter SnatA (MarC family)
MAGFDTTKAKQEEARLARAFSVQSNAFLCFAKYILPFFFASYFVEALIVVSLNDKLPRMQVRSAVFRANIVSYLLLALFTLGWLILSVLHGPRSG